MQESLVAGHDEASWLAMVDLALDCTEYDPTDRPNLAGVLDRLGACAVTPSPTQAQTRVALIADIEVPEVFRDPITYQAMTDPVAAPDG
jgi:hypothetical protein